jgi:transposase-like protein
MSKLLPDPDVKPSTQRRRYSASEKARILAEADNCEEGKIGALMRREGIYSSHLHRGRAERAQGELAGLTPHKRGRKADETKAQQAVIDKLARDNARLQNELAQAHAIIAIQKKVSELLGMLPAAPSESNV